MVEIAAQARMTHNRRFDEISFVHCLRKTDIG
jgi:hypothetical protein